MIGLNEVMQLHVRKGLDQEHLYSMVGKVSNVDSTKRTCDFTPIDGQAKRTGLRLQSVISEAKGVVLIPKDGTVVVATFFDTQTGFVSLMSELDKIHFEANGEDLKIILNDIIKEVNAAIIQTPVGPGTISAPTQVLLNLIDTRINKLFF